MTDSQHVDSSPILSRILHSPENVGYEYNVLATVVMGILACGLLAWFIKLPGNVDAKDSDRLEDSVDLDQISHQPAEA